MPMRNPGVPIARANASAKRPERSCDFGMVNRRRAFGRWIARRLEQRPDDKLPFGLSHERLLQLQRRVRERGAALIVFNRFVPAVRSLIFVAAGAARMKPVPVMLLGGRIDLAPVPGLLLGGAARMLMPGLGKLEPRRRRGEAALAQLRL